MRTAYFLVIALLCVSPALVYLDGPIVHALIVAFAAVTIGLIAEVIPPGQARHLKIVFRPVAILTAIVALWLLFQVIPVPKHWAHEIWSDAEAASGVPLLGSITVDPGATLVAVCRYFSSIGILLSAAAVTVDRVRAERMLFWIVGSITVSVLLQMLHAVVSVPVIGVNTDISLRMLRPALSALGLIVGLGAVVRIMARQYEKSPEGHNEWHEVVIPLGFVLLACAICGFDVVVFARLPIATATAAGLTSFFVILLVRRLRFGVWTGEAVAVLAVASVISLAVIFADTHSPPGDSILRFASQSLSSLNSIAQRMIADTSWAGSGAGSFELLLPIYRESGIVTTGLPAPTTAAKLTVELGRPVLWILSAMAALIVVLLMRGSLHRGRDFVYPAAGTGCMVILSLGAFCDASLLNTGVSTYALVALGLALSQRVSRMDH